LIICQKRTAQTARTPLDTPDRTKKGGPTPRYTHVHGNIEVLGIEINQENKRLAASPENLEEKGVLGGNHTHFA